MLVAFGMTNYTCFRDRQELSMEAVPRASPNDTYTFTTGIRRFPKLNRVSAIYGPNGSGKSRFIEGLDFVRDFVTGSSSTRHSGDEVRHLPFIFNAESRERPTTFEVSFIQDGTAYEYGFAVDRRRVHEEWLHAWPPGGRMRRLMERVFDPETDEEEWFFGPSVRGHKEIWRTSTRANALFVSTAAQLNSKTFQPVVDWFHNLQVVPIGGIHPGYTIDSVRESTEFTQRVVELLKDSDIAVSDIRTRAKKMRLDQVQPPPPPEAMEQMLRDGSSTIELVNVSFEHRPANSGERHYLDINDESDGTRRLFAFAGPWLDVLENDRVVVIDELDRSLHPLLVASLIRRINGAGAHEDCKRAQLVATLHDVTQLRDALDRSQIWFTEKDRESEAASLTPLSDFRPRPNEALVRGYLGGRYGGVPIVRESTLGGETAPRD